MSSKSLKKQGWGRNLGVCSSSKGMQTRKLGEGFMKRTAMSLALAGLSAGCLAISLVPGAKADTEIRMKTTSKTLSEPILEEVSPLANPLLEEERVVEHPVVIERSINIDKEINKIIDSPIMIQRPATIRRMIELKIF
jgi:hypothetical protein